MKVLSLFDGMACGMLAMMDAGVNVDRYVAFEIDKYAVQTSIHNFPMIEHRGDVFQANFTEFRDFDFLVGGSPCTYWSIAQKNNRETEASGMGWELFCQYVRALHEAKPKYFIYENNKSMSKAIRASIDKAFGFEAVCINSALVSAQNRQRLYWVGRRNEDGTYSRVNVEQPEDRRIMLKDVLESGCALKEKMGTIDANYFKGGNYSSPKKQSGQRMCVAEPVATNTTADGKARTLIAGYHKQGIENCCGFIGFGSSGVAEPVNVTATGKAQCLRSTCYKDGIRNMVGNTIDRKTCVAEPTRVGTWPNNAKNQAHDSQQYRIYSTDGKGVTLCGNGGGMGAKTGLYAVPVCMRYERTEEAKRVRKQYEAGVVHHGFHELSELHPRTDGKSNTVSTVLKDNPICEMLPAYATPCEWDEDGNPTKAISAADGKTYAVYKVKDGKITIKGNSYSIKLADGFYIIRKLTVRECMRLQTVPEWYEFPVSDTQAYKMLGNGWTVLVISHLIKSSLV